MTIDASRMGKDKTEIGVWEGLDLIKTEYIAVDDKDLSKQENKRRKKLTIQADYIEGIAKKY